MMRMSVPASSRWVAKLCRKVCTVTGLLSSARLAATRQASCSVALRAFAVACQSELAAATAELQAAKLAVQLRTLEIEKLKFQIAKLRRMQFGRSSERLTRQIEQLELRAGLRSTASPN